SFRKCVRIFHEKITHGINQQEQKSSQQTPTTASLDILVVLLIFIHIDWQWNLGHTISALCCFG
ncbi:MAG: hypothetical protein WCL54_08500, partial [Clostridia bacterium]